MALVIGLAGCSTSGTDRTNKSSSDKTIEEQLGSPNRDRDPSYDEASATKIVLEGGCLHHGRRRRADGSTVTHISADGNLCRLRHASRRPGRGESAG